MIKKATVEDAEILAALAIQMWTDRVSEDMAEEFRELVVNERVDNEVIPCFETDGESMDVYIACK